MVLIFCQKSKELDFVYITDFLGYKIFVLLLSVLDSVFLNTLITLLLDTLVILTYP